MEKKQENKLSMYQATEIFLDRTDGIWNSNIAFKKGVTEFKDKLGSLTKYTKLQIEDITGYALKKERLENELIKNTKPIASALYAYSFAINDEPLRKSVDFSSSDLLKLRDNEMNDVCFNTYNKGIDHSVALAEYGITQDMLEAMANSLKDFKAIIAIPRDMIDSRSNATEKIAGMFEEIDFILKNILDRIVNVFEHTDPDFYTEYKHARIIVDLGVRHEKEVEN